MYTHLANSSLPFTRTHVPGNSYITESQAQIQYFLVTNLELYVETNRVQSTAIPLENSKRHSTAAHSWLQGETDSRVLCTT